MYNKFYRCYYNILSRCNNKKHPSYNNYGLRGIKCEWKTFEEFKNDMYNIYLKHCEDFGEKDTTIDRMDVDGNYNKENCRWATYKEQGNNKRNNSRSKFTYRTNIKNKINKILNKKYIIAYGKKYKNQRDLAKDLGITYQAVSRRLKNKNIKNVGQYDLNGNLIKIWYSIGDIVRSLGYGRNALLSRCRQTTKFNKPYKGYYWKYLENTLKYIEKNK